MEKRFFKVGDTYIAIHFYENKVYLCEDSDKQLEVKVWNGKKTVAHVNKHTGKEIDEATFVEKFSGAVAKLGNDTPYA
jgi:hypothetical protein